MTDFEGDRTQARKDPPPVKNHEVMPRAARLAERLAYSDDPQDRDLWRQVRREVDIIFERLG